MKKVPRISESEWEVMKVLWKKSPATANEIVAHLTKQTKWKRETIRTFINRLVQKKVVGFEKRGRQYYYSAAVTEEQCVHAETKAFLNRVHHGSIEPMLAKFVEKENLSPEKIARLREVLDEARRTTKRKGKRSPH